MKGPKTITYKTCLNCELCKPNMIKSGRHPIREYKCDHPEAYMRKFKTRGYLGTDEHGHILTPEWCPYL